MIYPGNIIIWVALLLPLAAAASHSLVFKQLLVLSLFIIVVVSIFDMIRGRKILSLIEVSLPKVTRFSIFNEAPVTFTLFSNLRSSQVITLKPCFQESLISKDELMFLDVDTGKTTIDWLISPTQRGDFMVDTCYVEIKSPLGFWNIRKSISFENGAIRVYPNLQDDRQQLAALFLNRSDIGMHLNRMLGQGKEFEKLREYIPGDSMDIISWKATAKRNKPISKVFQQEQTQEVYAVIDVSRLSAKSIDGKDALEYYLSAALILGLITEKQKDNFGVIAFDSKVVRFIKSKGGKQHYNSCREAIYSLQPNNSSPNYNELFAFIRTNIRKRALLAFMIDLDDSALSESFIDDVHLVSKKHICIVNSIKYGDSSPLFEGKSVQSIDDMYGKLSAHIQWAELLTLRNSLYRLGINFTISEFDSFSTELISQYLNIKRRQLL